MADIHVLLSNRSDGYFVFVLGCASESFQKGLRNGCGKFATMTEGSICHAKGVRLFVPDAEGEVRIYFDRKKTKTFVDRIIDVVRGEHTIKPYRESTNIFIVIPVPAPT